MTITDMLDRLKGVKPRGSGRWVARCPAHTDKSPSLSVKEGDDGRLLVHCFAGCPVDDITQVLGLSVSDLFADARPPNDRPRPPKPARLNRVALAFQYELTALD